LRCETAADNRLFVEAVLWIAITGSPWRDLPACFGHWHRVNVRYHRSRDKGTWAKLLAAASDDPDLEYLMVDGRIVRVHPHGAGKKTAARRSDGQVPRRLEHKNSCNGGCLGQAGSLIAHFR